VKLSIIWPVFGAKVGDVLLVGGGSFELMRVHGVADNHAMVEREAGYTRIHGSIIGAACRLVSRPALRDAREFAPTPQVCVIPQRDLKLWTFDSGTGD
jgi:hypothetical protein